MINGLYEVKLKICETGKRRSHLYKQHIVRIANACEFTNADRLFRPYYYFTF